LPWSRGLVWQLRSMFVGSYVFQTQIANKQTKYPQSGLGFVYQNGIISFLFFCGGSSKSKSWKCFLLTENMFFYCFVVTQVGVKGCLEGPLDSNPWPSDPQPVAMAMCHCYPCYWRIIPSKVLDQHKGVVIKR